MSLRDTLFQSIATLDRIAPSDAERGQPYYSDEKVPVHDSLEHHRFPHAWTDDEKFIRLSTSSASLRYLRRSRSVPSIQPSLLSREADYSKMESHGEPKITWRHAAQVSRHILTVAFSFLSIGAAIAIIGLAADNINWGTGRGSQDANTVTAVIIGEYEVGRGYLERWVTKMLYLPSYYDTPTFAGLIVAAGICVLGGLVAAPLSIVYWKSTGRSVELGARATLSRRWVLLVCLVLDTLMSLTTLIVLICVRELYSSDTGYNRYDWPGQNEDYTIQPRYFDPPLPGLNANSTYNGWEPNDNEFRVYRSPLHYNPLNWNCRLQGHVSNASQHRIFQLCEEGNAARWLLVVMLLLQTLVLASHAWAWVEEKRTGQMRWTLQRLGSEERVAPGDRED